MEAYCRAKLANVLFTRQLANARSARRPSDVTVNAAHPGPVRSSFGMDGDLHGSMGLRPAARPALRDQPQARAPRPRSTWPRPPTSPARTGEYWVRSKQGHMSQHARDDEAARRLWDESERLLASAGLPAVR